MPRLSVWMVRTSMVYMALGFLFGALILAQKGIPFDGRIWKLLNPHIELMIFGWTMQLVMGIAFWILPRFSGTQRYGKVRLGWWSFGLFNSGVITAAAGGWLALGTLIFAGRILILVGVVLFVLLMWPRVKPLGGFAASQS